MQFTKVFSFDIDSAKRRVIKFLRFGKSDVQTASEIAPFGIDSAPVKDMIALYASTSSSGDTVLIGYINKNQLAAAGELRLYSTNSAGTAEQAYVWLRNNGNLELNGDTDNAVAYSKLAIEFNELKASHNALVALFNAHTHIATAFLTPTSTPPAPATASSADITKTKVDTVKLP